MEQAVNKETTSQKPEKEQTPCSSTNQIYQNIQQNHQKKIWTIPFLLESPKCKNFQPPDLEIDFLIDSRAESNMINIATWIEIKPSRNNNHKNNK